MVDFAFVRLGEQKGGNVPEGRPQDYVEPGNPESGVQPGSPSDEAQDPLGVLGQGLTAMVDGIQSSKLPDEVKQQADVLMGAFNDLVSMISGGGKGGVQPAENASAMAGGRQGAEMVR